MMEKDMPLTMIIIKSAYNYKLISLEKNVSCLEKKELATTNCLETINLLNNKNNFWKKKLDFMIKMLKNKLEEMEKWDIKNNKEEK